MSVTVNYFSNVRLNISFSWLAPRLYISRDSIILRMDSRDLICSVRANRCIWPLYAQVTGHPSKDVSCGV